MKVLILGGSGILSTDFTRKVLNEDNDVYLLNRGRHQAIQDNRVHRIIADFRNESVNELRKKICAEKYDVVVDFLTFIPEHLEKSLDVVDGLFEQYVFISSATAYVKMNDDEVITEKSEIGNKNWDYAYNKSLCEKELRKKDINYTIIRPYVTYGETRIPFPIIPNAQFTLLERIREEKPVVLFEDGKAICTLTSTKDFAEVLYRLLLNPKAYKEDFHITSPYRQTWMDVYVELCRILNKSPQAISASLKDIEKYFPEYKSILIGDKGTNMLFDNTKVMNAIDNTYVFQINLQRGLKESVDYYLSNKSMQLIDHKFDGECDYFISKKTGKRYSMISGGEATDRKMNYYIMTNPFTHWGVNLIRKTRTLKIRGGYEQLINIGVSLVWKRDVGGLVYA